MIDTSALALGLGASGTIGWICAIAQTHRLTKIRVKLHREETWHKGTKRLLQDAYQIEPEIPAAHELHAAGRMKRAVRAGVQELRRIAALDRPLEEPLDDIMRDPIAVKVDGHVNMITLTNAMVSAWIGETSPIGADNMIAVPVKTLESIAAEAQASEAIRTALERKDYPNDIIRDAYTMGGRASLRADKGTQL